MTYQAFPESRCPAPTFVQDGKVLLVGGVLDCKRSWAGEVYYPDPVAIVQFELDIIRRWQTMYKRCAAPLLRRRHSRSKVREIFTRTMLMDPCKNNRRRIPLTSEGLFGASYECSRLGSSSLDQSESWITDDFEGLFNTNFNKDPSRPFRRPSYGAANHNVLGRLHDAVLHNRFFITSSGLPGIGPTTTKVGDTVAVLTGANMPFVLRKGVSMDLQNPYTVVGVCYVHGIMDGEAVVGPDVAKVEEISLL